MKRHHLFEPLIVVELDLHGGDWTCGTPHAAHRNGGAHTSLVCSLRFLDKEEKTLFGLSDVMLCWDGFWGRMYLSLKL